MRVWLRRIVGVLAIYVIAISTILSTAVPPRAANAGFDPFLVICHSGQAAPTAEQTPEEQTPSKACDHCSLCLVTTSLAGPDAIAATRLAPLSVLQILMPVSTAARAHFAGVSNLARGPPQLT